jgi:hypothetical protein
LIEAVEQRPLDELPRLVEILDIAVRFLEACAVASAAVARTHRERGGEGVGGRREKDREIEIEIGGK